MMLCPKCKVEDDPVPDVGWICKNGHAVPVPIEVSGQMVVTTQGDFTLVVHNELPIEVVVALSRKALEIALASQSALGPRIAMARAAAWN